MEEAEPDTLRGVGVVDAPPRAAKARPRRSLRRLGLLVRPESELRATSVAWLCMGLVFVVGAVALGELDRLSPLELWATLFALTLPPLATVGTLMLGRRTPTRLLYRVVLDRAPAPPPGSEIESQGRTQARAAIASVCLGFGLLPVVVVGLAVELAAFGKSRGEIPDRLLEMASLVDGVWLLLSAAACVVVARWIARWEQACRRTALCPPLHSGLVAHVYYAEGGPPPALFPDATPPPAAPSPGRGAGSARRG